MSLDHERVQSTYTTIMKHFIEHGRAPHFTQLARMMSMSIEEARLHQAEAARLGVGCWLAHDTDYIESWAPFHNIPTQYKITINGEQKWYGQWGLESLAVRWLYPNTEIRLDIICLASGTPITIRMKDEEILEVSPDTVVGHLNVPFSKISSGEATAAYAWTYMNLFRSEEDVVGWEKYDPDSKASIMPVATWANIFSGPLFRNRLQPDIFAKRREYSIEFVKTLAAAQQDAGFS